MIAFWEIWAKTVVTVLGVWNLLGCPQWMTETIIQLHGQMNKISAWSRSLFPCPWRLACHYPQTLVYQSLTTLTLHTLKPKTHHGFNHEGASVSSNSGLVMSGWCQPLTGHHGSRGYVRVAWHTHTNWKKKCLKSLSLCCRWYVVHVSQI